MSLLRLLARRALVGVVAAWAVLTAVFALFTLTADWVLQGRLGAIRWGGGSEAAVRQAREQYLSARGMDRPLVEQYVDWLWGMATLDWGRSLETGDAVLPTVVGAVGRTAAYVLPAIALAILVGLAVGLYVALRPESRLARTSVGSAYLLFAIPNFWIGGMVLSHPITDALGHPTLLYGHVLPIALTATTLLGGYVSFTRAYTREASSSSFVRLIRAKGAGPRRVARHVLRNAAVPVSSLLFSEALALLVLTVFVVETLFGIEGFGLVLVDAVETRDLPVIMGGTLVLVGVSVVGTTLQDLSYRALDPRVDTEGQ